MKSRTSQAACLLVASLLPMILASGRHAEGDDDPAPQSFELRVVDLEGVAVPGAAIYIRSRPKVSATAIVVGKFAKANSYGIEATADSNGILRLEANSLPRDFSLSILAEGFAPFWAEFDQDRESLPESLTASIEPAWTVGGVILDAGRHPVSDAVVGPSFQYRKPPGNTRALHVGTSVKTDELGRWQYGHVPVSKLDVHVTVNHPDYQPFRKALPRSEFESKPDHPSPGTITLTQGYTLAGFVRDPAGNPIKDATVRTKFSNEIRETKSDEYGRYQLTGCDDRHCRVVVFAKGRALEMKDVRIGPEMEPVDFVLPKGGHVKVRVVDADGNGLPNASIFLQRWRGRVDYFEFDHVDCHTDEHGVWEWNEAPLDTFEADIGPRGGMTMVRQPITAREAEYVFQPPPLLVITGRVLDAESGEPITDYRVTPGHRNDNPRIGFDWYRGESYTSKTSNYRVQFDRSGVGYLVRIEAAGYRVTQSRDFNSDEGDVTYDFRLERAASLTGQIVDAKGQTAGGAKLAIADEHAQISIDNGEMDDSSTYATRLDADADGKFSLPARDDPFHIVVVHQHGHAFVFSESIKPGDKIELTPWSSIKGTFRIGAKPAANTRLNISGGTFRQANGTSVRVYADADAITDEQGNYRHDRIFDGRGLVDREIIVMVEDGASEVASTPRVPFTVAPGERVTVNLGGTGRSVTGHLQGPNDNGKPIAWNLATMMVRKRLVVPVPPVDRQAMMQIPGQWEAWLRTPLGINYLVSVQVYERQQAEAVGYFATIGRDGSFRIGDMPEGQYELDVMMQPGHRGSIRGYKFSIPPMESERVQEPVDLGVITLE